MVLEAVTNYPFIAYRKPTEKITDIQYQVLQLQREQLINQKETEKLVREKLTEQIKNLKLKNLKLEKELGIGIRLDE